MRIKTSIPPLICDKKKVIESGPNEPLEMALYNQPPFEDVVFLEIKTKLFDTSVGYGWVLSESEPPPTSIFTVMVAAPLFELLTVNLPLAYSPIVSPIFAISSAEASAFTNWALATPSPK